MSHRRYHRHYEPEEEEEEVTFEDDWVNNPILFHRTNQKSLRKIERDGILDPELCTMKEALCDQCCWGVCFSVESSSPIHGPHVFFGHQLDVLQGSWHCFVLRREGGTEYGGDIYPKPYVTILFSRNKNPPCRHYSRDNLQNYVRFIYGKRYFNLGPYAITVVVQEPVPLSQLSYECDRH